MSQEAVIAAGSALLTRRAALGGIAAIAGVAGCRPTAAPSAPVVPVEALRAGGYLLYLCHTETGSAFEQPGGTQRGLSERGREQARHIGVRVRALAIPIREIRASPKQRCIDTARLAFGEPVIEPMLTNIDTPSRPPGTLHWLREQLAQPVPAGANRAFVGHATMQSLATGEPIDEGETLVFRADGRGGFGLFARVPVDGW